jgi:hypothetical protein
MTRAKELALPPFAVRDCALIALSTGQRAADLAELRRQLERIDAASIEYHLWGGLLRPRFDDPEYRNDFAIWSRNHLHDDVLAERLGALDPTRHRSVEGLRGALLGVLRSRPRQVSPRQAAREPFHFVHSQLVVFDTGKRVRRPEQFARLLPHMSLGSVYYHFIDARRRSPEHVDDLRAWLAPAGDQHGELCARLARVDPYFVSLSELRRELAQLLRSHVVRRRSPAEVRP